MAIAPDKTLLFDGDRARAGRWSGGGDRAAPRADSLWSCWGKIALLRQWGQAFIHPPVALQRQHGQRTGLREVSLTTKR